MWGCSQGRGWRVVTRGLALSPCSTPVCQGTGVRVPEGRWRGGVLTPISRREMERWGPNANLQERGGVLTPISRREVERWGPNTNLQERDGEVRS